MATASYEYIPNETKHSLYIKTNVALRKQESSPKNNNKKKTILLYVIRLALTSFWLVYNYRAAMGPVAEQINFQL